MRTELAGLLLAAGAGRRIGGPKALRPDAQGRTWVAASTRRLLDAGCGPVRVVLGAEADAAAEALRAALDTRPPVVPPVDVVVAAQWREGMGASLRSGLVGLDALAPDAMAVVVHLVDLPDVGVDVVARVVAFARSRGGEVDVLARATYGGVPGHPVLLGRSHWQAVADRVGGDRGARDYLAGRSVTELECGDLASGLDVDRPVR